MKESFRLFLVGVLHLSCFFVGFSLFDLAGLNQSGKPINQIFTIAKIILGIMGIVLVSYYSAEPFWKTLCKLSAYSMQWLFLLLSLYCLGQTFESNNWYWWLTASVTSGLISLFALNKVKNSKLLN